MVSRWWYRVVGWVGTRVMGSGDNGADPGGTPWYWSGSLFTDFHRFSRLFSCFSLIFIDFRVFSRVFHGLLIDFGSISDQFG